MLHNFGGWKKSGGLAGGTQERGTAPMAKSYFTHNYPLLTILTGKHTGLCLYLTYQLLVAFYPAKVQWFIGLFVFKIETKLEDKTIYHLLIDLRSALFVTCKSVGKVPSTTIF